LNNADVLVEFGGTFDLTSTSTEGKSDAKIMRQKLMDHCSAKQERVSRMLKSDPDAINSQWKSYWINSAIIIKNANPSLLKKLAAQPEVTKISPEPIMQVPVLPNKISEPNPQAFIGRQLSSMALPGIQWGITKIGAPSVWASGINGSGIVIGSIDTGVRVTHEALAGKWRSNKGWYEPLNKAVTPFDDDGHGTHTIGTMVGLSGLGVAPGAQFISCKGCYANGCPASALLACAQFMMCVPQILRVPILIVH
jgi:subtilisin family serine protease